MTRARALDLARILFVLLTLGCAWLGFRGRGDEIADALADTSALGLAAALLVTLLGLALTAILWRRILARLGSPVPERAASAIFFVGQLGKYVPGSVWSFAAQAQLGRRHDVPARRSVTASGLFLLVHTATGAVVGTAAVVTGVLDAGGPRWLWALGLVAGAVVLALPVVRRDVGPAMVLMAGVWLAYGVGVLALLGPARAGLDDLPAIIAAFALSHVAGVLLVIAPAGLGAREGVLIALLEPVVGLDAAIATALLARVVHAAADFAIAGLAALRARRTGVRPSPGLRPADRRTDL
ncbi:lysylphosphatidylglycerol synthase domain-containing protein [Nocardioides mangrovi]|uniref:Flippase-like domain-containing protein n=1 Tax=Nocardioides mangrovi TaxID=2874580 RepID=A0ABS7U938_9ACTN|nr:lysylphosphatidylglycerol synthase domain-containing protein [Nocardioides mangrovi]MBZ5737493.1 hypothetical protein [Nocardioides mangrovi]